MTLKDKLSEFRNLILSVELAALLHDTGKLWSEFINYRKKWQHCRKLPDPHESWPDGDGLIEGDLNQLLDNKIGDSRSLSGNAYHSSTDPLISELLKDEPTFRSIIRGHTAHKAGVGIFIRIGDCIDSAYDRNEPLMAMEQLEPERTYSSTIFGFEKKNDVIAFDKKRKELFDLLKQVLPGYLKSFSRDDRNRIFDAVEKAFKYGLADTNRPANDITLWQHSYMTAAFSKIFLNHTLIHGKRFTEKDIFENFYDFKFAILGFGWDGLAYLSRGQKIGDVVGREIKIRNLKKEVKNYIEYECPLGMAVYDDNNGICFAVPEILESDEYGDLLSKTKTAVIDIATAHTEGELDIVTEQKASTHFVMDIVTVMDEISRKLRYPTKRVPIWAMEWKNDNNNTICPICGACPVTEKKVLCEKCENIRKSVRTTNNNKQTVFTDEIADSNSRLALISANFHLKPWLSGDMIWSLFVKESESLKRALGHLGKIVDFQGADVKRIVMIKDKEGCEIKDIRFNYDKIKDYINECIEETNFGKEISVFFKHKSTKINELKKWFEIYKSDTGRDIDICTYLLTLNHTPSRILHVWNTTRDFLRNIFNDVIISTELLPFSRMKLYLDRDANNLCPLENVSYEAVVEGQRVDIIRKENELFLVNGDFRDRSIEWYTRWERREITVKKSEFEKKAGSEERHATITKIEEHEENILPFRVITATPDMLMALVPAQKAVSISNRISQLYEEHFGKVKGRLSFSIGNVFFPKRTPLFVALAAGRKMVENFSFLYENSDVYWKVRDRKDSVIEFHNDIKWHFIDKLGDCAKDTFHPYLIVRPGGDPNCAGRPSCFNIAFLGNLIHLSEIARDDEIRVSVNYYDFEFLDANTRRHEIRLHPEHNNRRKSSVAGFYDKPFYLEELDQRIAHIWEHLLKGKALNGITDTKLRNLQSLWLTKYQKWTVDGDKTENIEKWMDFVTTSIKKEFPSLEKENPAAFRLLVGDKSVKGAIETGLFFDTLELYMAIMKDRIKD